MPQEPLEPPFDGLEELEDETRGDIGREVDRFIREAAEGQTFFPSRRSIILRTLYAGGEGLGDIAPEVDTQWGGLRSTGQAGEY